MVENLPAVWARAQAREQEKRRMEQFDRKMEWKRVGCDFLIVYLGELETIGSYWGSWREYLTYYTLSFFILVPQNHAWTLI